MELDSCKILTLSILHSHTQGGVYHFQSMKTFLIIYMWLVEVRHNQLCTIVQECSHQLCNKAVGSGMATTSLSGIQRVSSATLCTMLQECWQLALQQSQDLACATGSTTGNLSCQLSTMLQECWQLALQHSQDSVCATGSTPGNLSCQLSTMLQECCLLALQQMIFIANRVLPSLDKCRLIMAFFGPIRPSLVQFGLLCTNLG